MKKIISLFSALAVAATMITAFATTSLAATVAADSKPEIVGEVESVDGDNYAIMKFKLVNNEELSYALSRGKITSNGINMIQTSITLDSTVFDTTETYIMGGFTGVNVSGDNTNKLTFLFSPTTVDTYMTTVPEYLFEVDALLKDGYNKDNIPSSAITFGPTKVEYTSYAGVAASAGATTYTIYGANLEEGVAFDYTMKTQFGADEPAEPTKYAVTVVGGTADVAEAEEGATVTVTPVIPEGKQIASVTGAEVTAQANGTYTFTMPAEAVTITITYEDIPAPVFGYEVEKEATLYIDRDETKPVYQFDCVVENYAENNVTIKFACENATMTRLLENLPTIQGGAGLSFTALVANAPAAVTLTSIAD